MSKFTKSTNRSQAKRLKGNTVTAGTIDHESKIGGDSGSAITSSRTQRHGAADDTIKRSKGKNQLKAFNASSGTHLIAIESKDVLLLFKKHLNIPAVTIIL